MPNIIKNVTRGHLFEFAKSQVNLIKNRIRFLCFLALFVYFLATVLSFIFVPRILNPQEVLLWKIFIISSLLTFLIAGRAKKLGVAKFYGYIYTILLLYVLAKASVIYPAYFQFSSSAYIFIFFLVCFSIPWYPIEIIPIFIAHIVSYTLLFMYIYQKVPAYASRDFDVTGYFGGLIFLLLAFVLSFTVRKKENARDMENFILFKEAETRNEQTEKELTLARRVHETLIPVSTDAEFFDIGALYLPVSYMSGDYAKFYFLDNDLLVFIICDITGHGVSAALLVNRLHTEFEKLVREDKEPAQLLKELNEFILEEFEGLNMYLSAFCGLIDLQGMQLTYSNYGHPSQYLYTPDNLKLISMPSHTTLLGIVSNKQQLFQSTIPLRGGDRIVLFTDGIVEAKNIKGEEYAKNNLENFIKTNHSLTAKPFNQKLLEELNRFKWGAFADDVFLMNIRIK